MTVAFFSYLIDEGGSSVLVKNFLSFMGRGLVES
jgi:hypothetical protein